MKSLRRKLLLVIFVLLASLASITPILADGRCGELQIAAADSSYCMAQVWTAWVTAGQNDPHDPTSNTWGSKFVFSYLDDGAPGVPTSCGFDTFDKNGGGLLYFVYDSATNSTFLTTGISGGLSPGKTSEDRLSSPLGGGSPLGFTANIGGPVRMTCYSKDPEVLRRRIIAYRSFALYSKEGMKLSEVGDQINWTSSWRFSLPLMEGGENGMNYAYGGIAVFNAATLAEAPNPVTVRVCIKDSLGNQGPCRELTLNPATETRVGETKVVILSSLFGSDLYFPYPNGKPRGAVIYGTLTVESLGRTTIAVTGSALVNSTIVIGVPAIPVPTW